MTIRQLRGSYNHRRKYRIDPIGEFIPTEPWEEDMIQPGPCIGCGKMVRWHRPMPRGGTDKFVCFDWPGCERKIAA